MPEPLTTTSYDANNRQLTFGDKTLAYDDNGNLQSITDSNGTTLYSWNARNQLVAINGPTVNASFVYDGTGRRARQAKDGAVIDYLYDFLNSVQESTSGSVLSNTLTSLVIDESLTRSDNVSTVNFLLDALGNTIALANSAGIPETHYTYEPFGRESTIGVTSTNQFLYSGRERDSNDLYYYRNRYYQVSTSRFISEDPLRFLIQGTGIDTASCGAQSDLGTLASNLYSYVDNNPMLYGDPLGLDKKPRNCAPPANGRIVGTVFCQKCRAVPLDQKAKREALKVGDKCANCVKGAVQTGGRFFPPICSDCAWGVGTAIADRIDCDSSYTVNFYSGEPTSHRLCECRGQPGR